MHTYVINSYRKLHEMKTEYTKSQIEESISFWKSQLLAEALESKTESKLKDAAKAFAKAIGA